MDPIYRIQKYIGNLSNSDITIKKNELAIDPMKGIGIYSFQHYRGTPFPEINGTYYHDMTRYLWRLPHLYHSKFLFFVGDTCVPYELPVLVKTRPISGHDRCVLMDLDHPRHFDPMAVVDQHDHIPYRDKKDILVWRGATTGPGFDDKPNPRHTSRSTLVAQYGETTNKHIDIGLNSITQTVKNSSKGSFYSKFIKDSIHLPEMFTYKFHLSVEGHDVATNLKWVLYSNSVPFCPPFYVQSWILEDELIPWTHYIPVKGDYSDLEEKVQWGMNHPDQCVQIAKEGRKYMTQFMDVENEARIRQNILESYVKHVKII